MDTKQFGCGRGGFDGSSWSFLLFLILILLFLGDQ